MQLAKLFSNFTLLFLGRVLSKGITFLILIFLARMLGPRAYGYLEFTIGLLLFLALIVDMGSSTSAAREIAKDKNRISEIVSNIVILRVFLSLGAYVVLVIWSFFYFENETLKRLITVYGLTLLGAPGLLEYVFQGLDEMKWIAPVTVLRQAVFAFGVVVFVRTPEQIWLVGLGACMATISVIIYNLFVLRRLTGTLKIRFNFQSMTGFLSQAFPVGLSDLTWFGMWYSAPILLGILTKGENVGLFGAAHRPVMTLYAFVVLYFYNLLPSLSRSSIESPFHFNKLLTHSIRITSWTGLFLAFTVLIVGQDLLIYIFGYQYAGSEIPFQILIWTIPIALLSGHYRSVLIVLNSQRKEFAASACGAAVSLILSIALIPKYHAVGSAIAILTAVVINGVLAYRMAHKQSTEVPSLSIVVKPLLACGIMSLTYMVARTFAMQAAVPAGIVLFVVSAILMNREVRTYSAWTVKRFLPRRAD
jgi:O-antigen/teichoic acid export membrane protein